MQTNFSWAYVLLAHHEGGFADHSNDPGGMTNYGISLRFLREMGIDIDGDGDVDQDDIRAITPNKSRDIYKEKFWDPAKCDQIRSTMIAAKVFDMAVNMGQKQAYLLVQRAVNALGYKPKLKVDGAVGAKTLEAINSYEREDYALIQKVRDEQFKFYDKIIEKNPDLADFELGWRRRAAA